MRSMHIMTVLQVSWLNSKVTVPQDRLRNICLLNIATGLVLLLSKRCFKTWL